MKSLALCLGLAVLGWVAVPAAAQDEPPAYQLTEICPYGHGEVWSVPIVYGHLPRGSELQEKLERREIVAGGCGWGSGHTRATLCRRCGAREEDREGQLYWQRESEDLESFEIPFAEAIRLFPVIAPAKGERYSPPSYRQALHLGAPVVEEVSYTSTAEVTALISQVLAFGEEHLENLGEATRKDRKLETLRLTFGNEDIEGELLLMSLKVMETEEAAHRVYLRWRSLDWKE